MSSQSKIEWTDSTWNPVRGCARVSAGCVNCYAERQAVRFAGPGQPYEGLITRANGHPVWTGKVRPVPELLDQPLRWRKPRRVFVNSMSDLFHSDVPDRFIADVFGIMAAAHWHTFQVLTKRPERALDLLGSGCMSRFETDVEECMALYSDRDLLLPLPNVWLGVSVEDQITANDRIPLLLQTPAAVRFVSCEPLLGPVVLGPLALHWEEYWNGDEYIVQPLNWVICGGESGSKARPMHPDWARSLRDECKDAGVPFFFKRWGEWAPHIYRDGCQTADVAGGDGTHHRMNRVGKKSAGRLLDKRDWSEFPI